MYMGYVEYNIIYRSKVSHPEIFSETKPFTDIQQLQMIISTQAVEALRELYAADEVHIVSVHTDGYDVEGITG